MSARIAGAPRAWPPRTIREMRYYTARGGLASPNWVRPARHIYPITRRNHPPASATAVRAVPTASVSRMKPCSMPG